MGRWLRRRKGLYKEVLLMTRGKRHGGRTTRRHDRLASYDAVSHAVSATTLTPEPKSVTLSYPTFTLRRLTCFDKDKDNDKDKDKFKDI